MADTDAIDVLLCANLGYFQHLAVVAASLAESNSQTRINLHVISCDRDAVRERMLEETLARWPNIELRLYFADDSMIRDFFVDGFLSKECYLRLIAPEILPSHIKRLVYLDCDLVVVDDIRPLWELDLAENLVAAAPDFPRLPEFMSPEHRECVGIPQDATYVNSGVLVIDVEKWRSEGLAKKFADYVELKGSKLRFHDQDAINAVLSGRIHLLDPRWNLQARMYYVGKRAMPYDCAATQEARRSPAIIHYTGSEKPWLFRSRIARKREYFRNLAKTAWRDSSPVTGTFQKAEHSADVFLAEQFNVDYLQVLFKLRRLVEKPIAAILRSLGGTTARGGARSN